MKQKSVILEKKTPDIPPEDREFYESFMRGIEDIKNGRVRRVK